MMDPFEFNKFSAAFLIALILAMLCGLFSKALIHSGKLEKNAYHVPIKEQVQLTIHAETSAQTLEPITPKLIKANVDNGKQVFKKCMQCHSIEAGKNNIGPSLWHVVGRGIASLADYAYSSAFKERSKEKWDVEKLNQFIHNPRKYIPGTKMSFLGLEQEQERIDVIAYLQKNSQ